MEKNKEKLLKNYVKKSEGMRVSVPSVDFEIKITGKKKLIKTTLDFTYCLLPNGVDGYRLEYYDEHEPYGVTEIGTLIYNPMEKRWSLIQW